MFLITAGVYLAGAVAYGLLASGERQHWSRMDHELDQGPLNADENTFVSEASTATAASTADYGGVRNGN